MKKSSSYEYTLSKSEIESILRTHFEKILEKEDQDFKDARFMQDDFTYNFKDNNPTIDVVIILDETKMRKPR